MKAYSAYILITIFCFSCFGFLDVVHSNGGIGFDLEYVTSKSALPAGPTPSNPSNFKYFNFSLTYHDLADDEYYKASATLTSSTAYKGTMANYGTQTDSDIQFKRSDYVGQYAPLRNTWDYHDITSLSKTLGTDTTNRVLPGSIYTRCFDWGGSGVLTVTLYRKDPDTGTYSIQVDQKVVTIPHDNNGNGIADAWSGDGNKIHRN